MFIIFPGIYYYNFNFGILSLDSSADPLPCTVGYSAGPDSLPPTLTPLPVSAIFIFAILLSFVTFLA